MVREVVLPRLFGLAFLALPLVALSACGPALESGRADGYPAPAQTAESGEAVSDALNEGQTEPGDSITSGVAVSGAQVLNWGADDQNCIMPGLVITGSVAELPPCETEAGTGTAEGSEAATPGTQQEEENMTEATKLPDSETNESPLPQQQDPYAQKMTALAVDDLSQRLDIPVEEIEIGEVREVTWPDSSLGCPQPDMMYAQMLQDGLLIQLHVNGELYSYHSGGDQPPFLCEETFQHPPTTR